MSEYAMNEFLRQSAAQAKRMAIDTNDDEWLSKLNELAPDVEPEPWKPTLLDVLRDQPDKAVPFRVRVGRKP